MILKCKIKGDKLVSLLMYQVHEKISVEVCLNAFLVSTFDVGGQLQDLVPFTKGRNDAEFIG
jgi:hypothetical protein